MAPIDRGAQRPVPLGTVTRSRSEYVQGPVEPLEQGFGGQEPESGGGELEGQRQAVQASADGSNVPAFSGVNSKEPRAVLPRSTNRAMAECAKSDAVGSVEPGPTD